MKENTHQNLESSLFVNLVLMLSASAAQQLGRIPNPVTGKTEVNIDGARTAIDMLDMLRNKTRGNLSEDESRFLSDTIASLQLEFVRVADSASASAGPQTEKKEAPPPSSEAQQQSSTTETKKPKFHKTYNS